MCTIATLEAIADVSQQYAETDQQPRGRIRKPRPKPQRSIRLEVPLGPDARTGIVAITVGKLTNEYILDRLPSDFGTAYRLSNLDNLEIYDVLLDGKGSCCTCKGFCRWQSCKHVSGLHALTKAGKLAAADTRSNASAA
jgi:hypothetical protein